MDDLISRAAAIELIESRQRGLCPAGMFGRHAVYGTDREKFDHWQEIIDEIECLPIMDTVTVVHCRDCVYYNTTGCSVGFGWCEDAVVNTGVYDDFYCANGERRERK